MPATVTNRFLRNELENFEKEKDMERIYGELKYSALIIATNGNDFARVNIDGKELIPVFTDIHEYQKQNLDVDFRPEAYYFNFYLELLQDGCEGFVINPKSERFIVSPDILDVMDTDYMFHLDYQPFTVREITEIYQSMDNPEINEFKKGSRWDLNELMEILMKSDLLTLISTEEPLDEIGSGVCDCFCRTSFQCIDNYGLLFSKHVIGKNHVNSYSQFVNLPLFIDDLLKHDISGILLDNAIVLPRDFLISYMKGFASPHLDDYTLYAFSLGDG